MDYRVNGRFCLIRYSSVLCTRVLPRNDRRRLGFLVCIKCRRPALSLNTLPFAVILNRFAADFLVLMPFGRRIVIRFLRKRARNIGPSSTRGKMYFADLKLNHAEPRSDAEAELEQSVDHAFSYLVPVDLRGFAADTDSRVIQPKTRRARGDLA
jgi:hypothetical protein